MRKRLQSACITNYGLVTDEDEDEDGEAEAGRLRKQRTDKPLKRSGLMAGDRRTSYSQSFKYQVA